MRPEREPQVNGAVLLLRHREGQVRAFEELVRQHAPRVYAYFARCGVATSEREDLVQDVFTRVHRAAQEFDPERPLAPWLFSIAVNVLRNHWRAIAGRPKEQRGPREHLLVAVEAAPPTGVDAAAAAGANPADQLSARETARWLAHEMEGLPEIQREVLALACFERLSQEDVAAALDLPVNTVKTHLRRARLALARALARRDGEDSGWSS